MISDYHYPNHIYRNGTSIGYVTFGHGGFIGIAADGTGYGPFPTAAEARRKVATHDPTV